MGLFFVGAIGFVISLVLLIIRKKSRKTFGILTVLFLVIGIAGMISAMNTPAIDSSEMIGEDPRPTAIEADFIKINAGEWEGKFVKLTGEVVLVTEKTDKDIVFDLVTDDGYYTVKGVNWIGEVDFDIIKEDEWVIVYGTVEKPDNKTGIPIISASIVEK